MHASPHLWLPTLLITVLISISADAQRLWGRVTDASGTALPIVSVWIGKGNTHTHTDVLGRFQLEPVSAGDTLRFSFLGFQEQEVTIDKAMISSPLEVVMQPIQFELDQVEITSRRNYVSNMASIDLATNPVESSQEILQAVPGLFIGQHAGGGKAEQIFLRGFDVDHGTDVNITVDGVPVNMVSHAHGQGYADLHFLIPETIGEVDYGKGPYYVDKGNFATAGYVGLQTAEAMENSLVGVELGAFNTMRFVTVLDLLDKQEHNAYLAAEHLRTDGPFEAPQNFSRLNFLAKYSTTVGELGKMAISVSHFTSNWDASGQIPLRAVRSQSISRFGAIDDSEGGQTTRTQVALSHTKALSPRTFVKSDVFFTAYEFELYSNFTFYLNDPVNGDQIRQREDRNLFGFSSVLHQQFSLGAANATARVGAGLRTDRVDDIELSRTLHRRETLQNITLGNVEETNSYAFGDLEIGIGHWLIVPGLRLDAFGFQLEDALGSTYALQSSAETLVSPKLNVVYTPGRSWQGYFKTGVGFHSNDTRVVVAGYGHILPRAIGTDIGCIWKPVPRVMVNSALWHLYLEQEFVYVGDEGVVVPSGETRRLGFDLGVRYQVSDWMFLDADVNYAFARSLGVERGEDHIPLAPDFTTTGGLSIQHGSGFSGGLRYRYIADRPAKEDNSLVAEGYCVVDMNASYTVGKMTIGIVIDNLLDTEWNETQFATESRLMGEPEGVEEIHLTPGNPFALRGKLIFRF